MTSVTRPQDFDEEQVRAVARADWDREHLTTAGDSGGAATRGDVGGAPIHDDGGVAPRVDRDRFCRSLFELVDVWTEVLPVLFYSHSISFYSNLLLRRAIPVCRRGGVPLIPAHLVPTALPALGRHRSDANPAARTLHPAPRQDLTRAASP